MEDAKQTLLRIFAVLAVMLIIYNIFTGATVQKLGIPGIFEIEFDTSNANNISLFQSNDQPNAKIKDVWTEHNINMNNATGTVIHINFEINNFKDNRGQVTAFFFNENFAPLYTNDEYSQYATTDGQISAGTTIRPAYKVTLYEDLQIFIPYNEFPAASGKNIINFYVVVRDDQNPTELTKSNWASFWITTP